MSSTHNSLPTPCGPCTQEGRLLVELGEVASTTRYTLFGPALYALDASDSFSEDVTVGGRGAGPPAALRGTLNDGGEQPKEMCVLGLCAVSKVLVEKVCW
jgi:hypothetical protein